jgi:hypothetical protein
VEVLDSCWPSPSGNHYGCRHPQAPLIPSEAPSPRPHPPRQAEQAGRQPSSEEGDGDVPRRRVAGGGKRDGAEGTVEEIKGKIVHGENRGGLRLEDLSKKESKRSIKMLHPPHNKIKPRTDQRKVKTKNARGCLKCTQENLNGN